MQRLSGHAFPAEERHFLMSFMRGAPGRFGLACLLALLAAAHETHAQEGYAHADAQRTIVSPGVAPRDVDELEKVLTQDKPLTPVERRTLDIIKEAALSSSQSADLSAGYPQAVVEQPGAPSDSEQDFGTALAASPATENVRDPCLLSWDPRCYAKHAADYDPRWGYAPSMLRSRSRGTAEASTMTQAQGSAP
jgi:hypothetical protein